MGVNVTKRTKAGLPMSEGAFTRLLADLEREDLDALQGMMTAKRRELLERIYPMHFSNVCRNECLYCGHRAGNRAESRRVHSISSNLELINKISDTGAKRVQLIFNYDENELHTVLEVVRFATMKGLATSICTEGLDLVELQRLKAIGIGEYHISQETFDREKYAEVHLSGRKADYRLQFEAPELACQLGFKVGIGLLLGLHDWRADIFSLMSRVHELAARYPKADISIFFNLLRPTPGGEIATPVNPISPLLLKKIVMSIRITCPSIGIATTTREVNYADLEGLIDYEIVSFQGHKGL